MSLQVKVKRGLSRSKANQQSFEDSSNILSLDMRQGSGDKTSRHVHVQHKLPGLQSMQSLGGVAFSLGRVTQTGEQM